MTPVQLCLEKVWDVAIVTDTTVLDSVAEALDELESAFHRPSEGVVALEAVSQAFSKRRGSAPRSAFDLFLLTMIERRQGAIARHCSH